MWLLEVIFIACLAAASVSGAAGEVKLPTEQAFVPRYTPESKRQDLDLPASGQSLEEQQQLRPPVAGDKKPWRRRVDYGYDGVSTAAWSAAPSPPAAILSILNPLLAPGLLLLGVNLGALLYMLLGLLGLAPHRSSSRSGSISQAWPTHSDEILYRHNLGEGGKETAVYF
ncbi:uncharacterized protein [Drosophila kikkawai]|uniref:Uncharacterized protein n=1 Tax=Drosophila kikkawai TaxID=30033 RepID=A0A6P4IYR7_DROKI|nr:uncharacterized protein LOC108078811 [Drosophila kikkawai]